MFVKMLTLKEAIKIENLLQDAFLDVFIDGSQEGSIIVHARQYNHGTLFHNVGANCKHLLKGIGRDRFGRYIYCVSCDSLLRRVGEFGSVKEKHQ